jgi:HEAT repeat protein
VSDAAARRRAAALAGHQGDVDCAVAALADPEPIVRATSLGALERMGRLRADWLCAALSDLSPSVRRRAAELAARHPDVSLHEALHDEDPDVVEAAAFACGEQESVDAPVVHRLAELTTSSEDALVREAAVAALGAIGDPIALPAILVAAQDCAAVRRRAVLALAPFDGPDVDAALARALEDRDWQVRQAAEDLTRVPREAGS